VCKLKTLVIILFSVSLVSISNAASIIYVDVNGPNDPGTGTFDDPFRKIQDAIDDANDGDTIEIRPGLYSGERNYDLDPNGLAITIRSTDPNNPNVIANTIIDPNSAGRGFYFHSGEDANCVVSGLTIRNACSVTSDYGGGIYCRESSPTIRNCVIKNGYATDSGGGLFCSYDKPRIINCTIIGNFAEFYGGGISCYCSDAEIVGCIISSNTAVEGSGGFDLVLSSPVIVNCVVTNNKATNGGGIGCYSPGEARLVNCTIARNIATDLGGALSCRYGSSATVENSIIRTNEANQGPQICLLDNSSASVKYCDIQGAEMAVYDPCDGLAWGTANMDADPCFASFDPNGDPNKWDFHLQSAYGRWEPNSRSWVTDSNTSPCIDAGDPNSDWSGEPWPNGKRINMGAYGGTSQASMNGNPADFDINGSVNFTDFAAFSNKWFAEEFCIEDLTNNGVVDFGDLAKFSENWLWQRE